MAIIAKDEGSNFKPHPQGQARVVCADVYDQGMQQTFYGMKHKVRLVFVSEIENPEDKDHRFYEHSMWFTLSLNAKADLRKFIEAWRGRPFTEEQIEQGWDVSKVKGATGYAQFTHVPKQDGSGVRAVMTIMKLPKGMQPLEIPGYFEPIADRVAKREAEARQGGGKPVRQSSGAQMGRVLQPNASSSDPDESYDPFADEDDMFDGRVDDDDLPF